MNKNEFVKLMAAKARITNADAAIALEGFIDAITEALKSGEKVSLVGFGTFELKDVPEKEGINPATGEKIQIAACKKPVVKFGGSYKDLFNY